MTFWDTCPTLLLVPSFQSLQRKNQGTTGQASQCLCLGNPATKASLDGRNVCSNFSEPKQNSFTWNHYILGYLLLPVDHFAHQVPIYGSRCYRPGSSKLWPKSSPPPVFKVLSEHSQASHYILFMAAFLLQEQSWVTVAENAWPASIKYYLTLYRKFAIDH